MSDRERIYVVVAETIDTPNGVVRQPAGRMAAQACHVVSRMKLHCLRREVEDYPWPSTIKRVISLFYELVVRRADEKITTIILSCRDSKELNHVFNLLNHRKVNCHWFHDENPPVYGDGEFLTAIATVPVEPEDVTGILDYLPLALSKY